MKSTDLIVVGLAGIAVVLITKASKSTASVNPANGTITRPRSYASYTQLDFGTDAWSDAINKAANARLARQG